MRPSGALAVFLFVPSVSLCDLLCDPTRWLVRPSSLLSVPPRYTCGVVCRSRLCGCRCHWYFSSCSYCRDHIPCSCRWCRWSYPLFYLRCRSLFSPFDHLTMEQIPEDDEKGMDMAVSERPGGPGSPSSTVAMCQRYPTLSGGVGRHSWELAHAMALSGAQ